MHSKKDNTQCNNLCFTTGSIIHSKGFGMVVLTNVINNLPRTCTVYLQSSMIFFLGRGEGGEEITVTNIIAYF